jgi:hypothetical protein
MLEKRDLRCVRCGEEVELDTTKLSDGKYYINIQDKMFIVLRPYDAMLSICIKCMEILKETRK